MPSHRVRPGDGAFGNPGTDSKARRARGVIQRSAGSFEFASPGPRFGSLRICADQPATRARRDRQTPLSDSGRGASTSHCRGGLLSCQGACPGSRIVGTAKDGPRIRDPGHAPYKKAIFPGNVMYFQHLRNLREAFGGHIVPGVAGWSAHIRRLPNRGPGLADSSGPHTSE